MKYIDDYFNKTRKPIEDFANDFHIREKIVCGDGTTISVQASRYHYCSPRETDALGGYWKVEVGYPSVKPEPWHEWQEYCENPDNPTNSIYGYVPVELVDRFIESHGGINYQRQL